MSYAARHRRPAGVRLLLALAAFALVAAACGDDDTDVASSPTTTAATATTAAEATTTTAAPASSGGDYGGAGPTTTAASGTAAPAVELAETSLGSVLTADGMTLYGFTPDTEGVSTCYDACADNWPALTGEPTVGAGLDAALFGTAPRTDGTTQVTIDGHPLYFFAADAAPGDTNGQGVGDKWYVVGADGALIMG
jgi:predicted lipoprotein with Yx(FWY)xxD motif